MGNIEEMCNECGDIPDELSKCTLVKKIRALKSANSQKITALNDIIKVSGNIDATEWPIQLQQIQAIARGAL